MVNDVNTTTPTSLDIEQLARCPEHLFAVATWIYQEWWRDKVDGPEVIGCRLMQHLQEDRVPLTLVAMIDDEPVGCASIIHHDLEVRPELSPWLATVFVRPQFRKRGVGGALVQGAMDKAEELRLGVLYLATRDQCAFCSRFGFCALEEDVGLRRQTIMRRYIDS
jgi:predicted N-acetyltransferase YhbS